jgi:hypothetical protein
MSNQDVSYTMSLLTTTTGFVDVYVIDVHEQLPWLIPQNLVLAALSAESGITDIEWRDHNLPVLNLVHPQASKPVALVIENMHGDRFALLIEKMPESRRVRISSLHDVEMESVDPEQDAESGQAAASQPFTYQLVTMEDQLHQVPDFEKINQHLAPQQTS